MGGDMQIPVSVRGLTLTQPQFSSAALPNSKRLLPPQLVTTLYGRTEIYDRARTCLENGQPVVLHGMAGMGKSALASFVAWSLIDRYPNGVLWIDGGTNPIDSICDNIGQQLEDEHMFNLDPATKPSRVRFLLGAHNLLVVLDDCWNADVARTFAQRCLPAGHGLLVTSREKIARLGALLEVGSLDQDAGISLFRDAAGDIGNNNPSDVDHLVELLGGHPQALVVAGQLCCEEEISIGELLTLLGPAGDRVRRLKLGADASNNVWATFELSYQRLKTEEQIVFRALGGAWSKSATTEVMSYIVLGDEDLVDGALRGLVKRALARVEEMTGGVRRYILHDLLHAFAQGLVIESGSSVEEIRSEWLKAAVQYVAAHCLERVDSHDALEAELDNLLSAANLAAEQSKFIEVNGFAHSLCTKSQFLFQRGYNIQAVSILTRAIDATRKLHDERSEGIHLGNLGYAHALLSNYSQAIDCYNRALLIARKISDRENEAQWLGLSGLAYDNTGNYHDALQCYESAIAIERSVGNKVAEGRWIGSLAGIQRTLGNTDHAIALYKQAIELAQQLSDRANECIHLSNLASVFRFEGDYTQALSYYSMALPVATEIHDRATQGRILVNTAVCLTRLGNPADALSNCTKGLELFSAVGFKSGEAYALGYMGEVLRALGKGKEAEEKTQQALRMHRDLGVRSGIADWLHNLGGWALEDGNEQVAVNWLREAFEIRRELGNVNAKETQKLLQEAGYDVK